MSVDTTAMELRAKHEQLREQLTSLAVNHELNADQRDLAHSWRDRIDFVEQRASAPLSVAFLAAVGRGKSSLIAAVTGLRLDVDNRANPKRWSVLPVAAGRTTLGEICIEFDERTDIMLAVEPITARALETEIRIFAQDRFAASRKVKGTAGDDRGSGEELAGLLESWLASAADEASAILRKEALEADSVEIL